MNTMTDTMRQMLVDAAAAIEDLTDLAPNADGSDECLAERAAAVRLAGRLRDAAAGGCPLDHAREVGATIGRRQGWDVFDCSTGEVMVQADDDPGDGVEPIDDSEAIRLARRAGVACDDDGVVAKATRSWDVFMDTAVNVEVPADVDPDTDEGLAAIKAAAAAKFVRNIDEDSFDISVEEYCGE